MDIGELIRTERKQAGLTQKQLADKAGVGLNFVYQLEKNKPSVQLDCTRQVLEALGLEIKIVNRSISSGFSRMQPDQQYRPPSPWDQ
jgi:y4mF family transcriptional regulator